MPLGLKNKTVNQAHHHHHQGQKIDHTRGQLLTHKVPLEPPEPDNHLFDGSEVLIGIPLPRLYGKNVPVIELLLYDWQNRYICSAKDKEMWLIRMPDTIVNLE